MIRRAVLNLWQYNVCRLYRLYKARVGGGKTSPHKTSPQGRIPELPDGQTLPVGYKFIAKTLFSLTYILQSYSRPKEYIVQLFAQTEQSN